MFDLLPFWNSFSTLNVFIGSAARISWQQQFPDFWLIKSNCNTPSFQSADLSNPSEDVITVIEAPNQSDLMIELVKKLKPQVVVSGLAHFEAVTSSAFQHLLDITKEIGSRLFIDISDHFELSSLPGTNGVLKYLAGNPLPPHAAIVCGLVKNQVFLISHW